MKLSQIPSHQTCQPEDCCPIIAVTWLLPSKSRTRLTTIQGSLGLAAEASRYSSIETFLTRLLDVRGWDQSKVSHAPQGWYSQRLLSFQAPPKGSINHQKKLFALLDTGKQVKSWYPRMLDDLHSLSGDSLRVMTLKVHIRLASQQGS